jgi:hypothetical protein
MVHDNPYLEVWRSLPLDQTELNIFCKWSRLNQIEKMILTYHAKGGEVIHKDRVIGGANKWNDIVRGSTKIWSTQVGRESS